MLPELKTTTLEAFLNVNPRYRLEMERVMNSEKARLVPALGLSVLTPFYDWVVQRTTREKEFKSALIEQSGIQAGQRVLDLACGTGTLTLSIKGSHPDVNVEGIDGDHSILAIARSKAAASGLDVHFQQALAYALPFTNATFDRVVSSLFFHHLNWLDKQKTVREVIRVLKPDGEFHIADWGRPSNVMMRMAYIPVQLLDGFSNTDDNLKGKLVKLLEGAGFTSVEETRHFNTPLGTLRLISGKK
jgi:ubiquinone/menaquinone biosynthesis C-methylase UbiE